MKRKRACTAPGCRRPHYARDYCSTHYRRLRRGAVIDFPIGPRRSGKRPCAVTGCPTHATTRGYCPAHYARFHRYGDPLAGSTFRKRPRHDYF
jgi:hypothetical protein